MKSAKLFFILIPTIIFACGKAELGQKSIKATPPSSLKFEEYKPVQLLRASSEFCPPVSGCYSDEFFQVLIEVSNLAYDKQVEVMIQHPRGREAVRARYLKSLANGDEIWIMDAKPVLRGFKFFISYRVGDEHYIDNNNGDQYEVKPYGATRILGPGQAVMLDDSFDLRGKGGIWSGYRNDTISGWLLKSHADASDQLDIVYTLDNWQTVESSSVAAFPNGASDGSLAVPFKIAVLSEIDHSEIHFAIRYQREGRVYWDNNGGIDYGIDQDGGFKR